MRKFELLVDAVGYAKTTPKGTIISGDDDASSYFTNDGNHGFFHQYVVSNPTIFREITEQPKVEWLWTDELLYEFAEKWRVFYQPIKEFKETKIKEWESKSSVQPEELKYKSVKCECCGGVKLATESEASEWPFNKKYYSVDSDLNLHESDTPPPPVTVNIPSQPTQDNRYCQHINAASFHENAPMFCPDCKKYVEIKPQTNKERIEVDGIWGDGYKNDNIGGYCKFSTNRIFQHEKYFPLIKQAIEKILNNEK